MTLTKAELARRAWGLMFDYLVRTSPRRLAAMGRKGMTPNDMRALATLCGPGPRTMRALADEWKCDASNVTLIVNRLEQRGLVQRVARAADARYREVRITAKGRRLYTELVDLFHAPPPEILELTAGELEMITGIMEKLSAIG